MMPFVSFFYHNNCFSICSQLETLTIYPPRLLFKSKAWYLESLCTDKNDYRLFRLNRMISVMQTVKTFKRTELLNKLADRTDYSDDLTLTNIKLKCTAGIAYRLYIEKNNRTRTAFTVLKW